jgi:hypothetical protein
MAAPIAATPTLSHISNPIPRAAAHVADGLPLVEGLDQEERRLPAEEPGLLIGLAQQGQVVQLEALVGAPQPVAALPSGLDGGPVTLLYGAQSNASSLDHRALPPCDPGLGRLPFRS